jgi:ech hydrogenase subunit D
MSPDQTIDTITVEALVERVRALRDRNYRIVQVGATRLPEDFELTYSFDLDGKLLSLRLLVPASAARVPSISAIYGCAALYENELHDLFNLEVQGMTLDFKGNFYKTAVKFPFSTIKAPATKAPPAAKPAPAATPASTSTPSATAS